jgi:hypothetical protein
VTHLAAALDFAAAADVHHGALSPRDIIFAPQSTGVSGFGLVQAMREAGVDVDSPNSADDIYALAAMTFELLVGYRFAGGSLRDALAPLRGAVGVDYEALVAALEPTLSSGPDGWPSTALAFAASLHAAQTQARTTPPPREAGINIGRLSFGLEEPEPSSTLPSVVRSTQEGSEPEPSALAPPPSIEHPDTVAETAREQTTALQATQAVTASVRNTPDAPLRIESAAAESRPSESWPEPPAHSSFDAPLHAATEPSARERMSDPLVLHPHDRPTAAPVFMNTLERVETGSRWGVMAVGVVLAAIVIAGGVWMFERGRTTAPSSPGGVDSTLSEPAERVEEPQPVVPGAGNTSSPPASAPSSEPLSAPSATAPAAPPVADVPPVIQEPPARERPSARTTREETPKTPTAREPAPKPHAAASPQGVGRASRPSTRTQGVPSNAEGRSTTAGQESHNVASSRQPRTDAPASTGRILVRSTPAGATVTVDGVPRGQTPAAIRELSFGSHVILVTAVGYPQWQQTITLTEDRPSQSFEVSLEGAGATTTVPGAAGLQVDSRPSGARVFVDGTAVGVTPLQLPTIAAGTHMIRIELAGFRPWATSVTVTSGQRTRVAASLEQ